MDGDQRAEVVYDPDYYPEAHNVADQRPEIVARRLAMMKAHEADLEPREDMLAIPWKK